MSALPKRFPRANLIQNAAALESRLNQLMDDTLQRRYDAEDRGLDIAVRKLKARFETLSMAQGAVNEARLHLWNLE